MATTNFKNSTVRLNNKRHPSLLCDNVSWANTLITEYLVIAGGGGSSPSASGAGAGGYLTSTDQVFNTPFLITVGAGGTGAGSVQYARNQPGNPSVLGAIVATGGGGGRNGGGTPGLVGSSGGSGSGSYGATSGVGGSGIAGQGNNGGAGWSSYNGYGGGGGAGSVGGNSPSSGSGGNGGNGLASSITGSSVTRAGGGGAAGNPTAGTGGTGGGGNGATTTYPANNTYPNLSGQVNTGGGAGGGQSSVTTYGNGGSGVVIIAYPDTFRALTSIGAGLTYTVSTSSRPGYRVYTFTAGTGMVTY